MQQEQAVMGAVCCYRTGWQWSGNGEQTGACRREWQGRGQLCGAINRLPDDPVRNDGWRAVGGFVCVCVVLDGVELKYPPASDLEMHTFGDD